MERALLCQMESTSSCFLECTFRHLQVVDLPLNLAHTPFQVIVGGTKIVDDYFPAPRPETAEDILKRGFELCPELAPPEIRAWVAFLFNFL